jgi:hypothetical protein
LSTVRDVHRDFHAEPKIRSTRRFPFHAQSPLTVT